MTSFTSLAVVALICWHPAQVLAFIPSTTSNGNNNNGSRHGTSSNPSSIRTGTSTNSNSSLLMSLPNSSRTAFSTRKTPLKFLRIQPKRSRNKKQRVYELQTAVATMGKILEDGTEVTIDLHSQLHFGRKGYFQFYNDKSFGDKYDNVF
jgi:hypothetical protein